MVLDTQEQQDIKIHKIVGPEEKKPTNIIFDAKTEIPERSWNFFQDWVGRWGLTSIGARRRFLPIDTLKHLDEVRSNEIMQKEGSWEMLNKLPNEELQMMERDTRSLSREKLMENLSTIMTLFAAMEFVGVDITSPPTFSKSDLEAYRVHVAEDDYDFVEKSIDIVDLWRAVGMQNSSVFSKNFYDRMVNKFDTLKDEYIADTDNNFNNLREIFRLTQAAAAMKLIAGQFNEDFSLDNSLLKNIIDYVKNVDPDKFKSPGAELINVHDYFLVCKNLQIITADRARVKEFGYELEKADPVISLEKNNVPVTRKF